MRYSFACFSYDAEIGCFRGEHRLPLSRLECRVLGCLVSAGGRLVTKDGLAAVAWQRGLVSDESIARAVHAIRRKLGVHTRERVVETLYSQGYRLAVPVQRVTAAPVASDPAASTAVVVATLRDLREALRRGAPADLGRVALQVERVERLLAESR